MSESNTHSPPETLEEKHDPSIAPSNENKGPPPPPDGGTVAWIQCAAAFCIFINTWGLLNAYGAFQAYYQQELLRSSSASAISWIGTVQSCFIMLGSVYAGPLYDMGYMQATIRTGCFLLVFGMFMTSLCYEYWQVMLAQGLCMGIGLGCLFLPTLGVISSYFTKRRGLAIGVASSGSTIGGIIYPIIFYRLVNNIGFGWTCRVIAFLMLALSAIPALGMRMRVKPPAVRKLFHHHILREPAFTLYMFALFVGYIGMYTPYFYIQVYCVDEGIVTGDLNFYLLPIVNAAGFFGRIAFGALADKIGAMNAFIFAGGGSAVLIFGWIGLVNTAGVIVFCIFYGFFSAGLTSLCATVVTTALCPDLRQLGVRLTMQLVPSAIGLLIGNPIAGAILTSGWLGLQVFGAATVLLCMVFAIAGRLNKTGFILWAKC